MIMINNKNEKKWDTKTTDSFFLHIIEVINMMLNFLISWWHSTENTKKHFLKQRVSFSKIGEIPVIEKSEVRLIFKLTIALSE